MVKKMGRPTENPKIIQTRIRMTKDEASMLNECAIKLGKQEQILLLWGYKKSTKK